MQKTTTFVSFVVSYSDSFRNQKNTRELKTKLACEGILEYGQKFHGRLERAQVPFNTAKDDSMLYEREVCLVVGGTAPPGLAE